MTTRPSMFTRLGLPKTLLAALISLAAPLCGWAQDFKIISLTSDNYTALEVEPQTGDDRGGIALSPTRVFLTGDNYTGSFPRTNLSGGAQTTRKDGIFSNLADDTVYVLADASGAIDGDTVGNYGATVTRLIQVDGTTGDLTATSIALSGPITLSGNYSNNGVFAGVDRVVIWDGTNAWQVALPSGTVTNLGTVALQNMVGTEQGFRTFGVAEHFDGADWLTYGSYYPTGNYPARIARTRIGDNQTEVVADFGSPQPAGLSDLASFTVSLSEQRWYFHYESTGIFGGSDETLGFADAVMGSDDFSDAPLSYGVAQHKAEGVRFGAINGIDGAARHSPEADLDRSDDGLVSQSVLFAGQPGSLTVNVQNTTGTHRLSAWVDWDNDGTFGVGEQVATDVAVSTDGDVVLPLSVPAGAVEQSLHILRMRVDNAGGLAATGTATEGEVEDHAIAVGSPSDTTAPVADIVDVTPDPRTMAAGLVTVTFNEPVLGVGVSDFTLTRNAAAVDLATATVARVSATEWTINLAKVTNLAGDYVLTVFGPGIADYSGNALAVAASDAFTVNIPPAGVRITAPELFTTESSYYYGPTYGWSFTPLTDVTVTELGTYDPNTMSGPRQVGLWDSNQQLLGSTTVAVDDPVADSFRYHALDTPVTLQAGQTYYVASSYPYGGNDEVLVNYSGGGIETDPAILFGSTRNYWYAYGGLSFPYYEFNGYSGYFGANLRLSSSTPVATLVNDHFTGNSNGVPAGWTDVGFDTDPNSTISESGTWATITDTRSNGGPQFMRSAPVTLGNDFTLVTDIGQFNWNDSAQPEAMMALGNLGSGNVLLFKYNTLTGAVTAQVVGPNSASLTLGNTNTYSWPMQLLITGDADSFRVRIPNFNYDSGDILYSAIGAAGFDSLDDLGATVSVVLGTESADGGGTPQGTIASTSFDRVVLVTTSTGGTTDTTAPDTTITSTQPTPTNSSNATVEFTGSDDVTAPGDLTFEGRLDGGSFAPVTSPMNLSGLADGSHTYEVRAKDAANNVDATPASVTWTVDTTGPAGGTFTLTPSTSELAGTPLTLRADGWSDPSGPLTYRFFYGNFFLAIGPASSSNTQGLSFFTPGPYSVSLEVADALGNTTQVGPLSFNIVGAQAIAFDPPAAAFSNEVIALSAVGGASGNPVTFSLVSGPGVIDGSNNLTFTGSGSVVVRASQAGSANYLAAPDVERTIAVLVPLTVVDDWAFTTKMPILIDVTGNDSGSGAVTLLSVTAPSSGKTKIEDGKVRFTPTTALSGPVTFTYTATDGVQTDTGTVTVRPFSDGAGTYVGLLKRADDTIRGRVVFTATALGQMTGQMRYEGRQYVLKGGVNWTDLAITGTLPQPKPAVLGRAEPDALGQPVFTLTVPDSIAGQTLTGIFERSPYSPGSPAPQVGLYTIVGELPVGGTGPARAGSFTCSVVSNGTVKFSGKTANGVAVTQGGKLLAGGRLPFFVSTGLGAAMQGLGGEMVFDPSGAPDVTGTLRWKVPTGTLRLAAGVDQDYAVDGRTYTVATSAAGMFSPAAPTATLTLNLPSFGAGSPVVRTLTLSGSAPRGTQKVFISAPGSGYITFNVKTGFFSGVFTLGGTRSFSGVVQQVFGESQGSGMILDAATLGEVTIAP